LVVLINIGKEVGSQRTWFKEAEFKKPYKLFVSTENWYR